MKNVKPARMATLVSLSVAAVGALALAMAAPASADIDAEAAAEPASTSALLIVDIQEFYFPGGTVPLVAPEAASANARRVLDDFRARGDLVVHVRHQSPKGMDIHADVQPQEGEVVVTKTEVNSFHGTDLLEILREKEVERLVLVGMQTHMCLEAATRAAADLGFECVVVGDACATRDLEYDDRTVSAADVHSATLATLRAYAEVVDTEAYLKQ